MRMRARARARARARVRVKNRMRRSLPPPLTLCLTLTLALTLTLTLALTLTQTLILKRQDARRPKAAYTYRQEVMVLWMAEDDTAPATEKDWYECKVIANRHTGPDTFRVQVRTPQASLTRTAPHDYQN